MFTNFQKNSLQSIGTCNKPTFLYLEKPGDKIPVQAEHKEGEVDKQQIKNNAEEALGTLIELTQTRNNNKRFVELLKDFTFFKKGKEYTQEFLDQIAKTPDNVSSQEYWTNLGYKYSKEALSQEDLDNCFKLEEFEILGGTPEQERLILSSTVDLEKDMRENPRQYKSEIRLEKKDISDHNVAFLVRAKFNEVAILSDSTGEKRHVDREYIRTRHSIVVLNKAGEVISIRGFVIKE